MAGGQEPSRAGSEGCGKLTEPQMVASVHRASIEHPTTNLDVFSVVPGAFEEKPGGCRSKVC
jgi:hypothetical protein